MLELFRIIASAVVPLPEKKSSQISLFLTIKSIIFPITMGDLGF